MDDYYRRLRKAGEVAEAKFGEWVREYQPYLRTSRHQMIDYHVVNTETGEAQWVDVIGRICEPLFEYKTTWTGIEDEWTASYPRLKKRKKFARERNTRVVYCFIDVTDEDGRIYVHDRAFHEFVDIMDLELGRKVVRKGVRSGDEFVVIERTSLYSAKQFGLSEGEFLWEPPSSSLQ
jgi:hypothetical protein